MKGVIVFKGRYGATEQYAQWLGTILQIPVYEDEEVSNTRLSEFDYVIAGTAVYIGKMLLAKWINSREQILARKKLFLFVVCATPATDSAELNNLVTKNITPGLIKTMKIFFLRGRMIKSRLSLMDTVALRIGAALQKTKSDKERMLTDFDEVRQANLNEILNAIKAYSHTAVT